MEWININEKEPSPNNIVLAWDGFGKSVGVWDGFGFYSISDGYSFDIEYAEVGEKYIARTEGDDKICGQVTHWIPLPRGPKEV